MPEDPIRDARIVAIKAYMVVICVLLVCVTAFLIAALLAPGASC